MQYNRSIAVCNIFSVKYNVHSSQVMLFLFIERVSKRKKYKLLLLFLDCYQLNWHMNIAEVKLKCHVTKGYNAKWLRAFGGAKLAISAVRKHKWICNRTLAFWDLRFYAPPRLHIEVQQKERRLVASFRIFLLMRLSQLWLWQNSLRVCMPI